MRKLKPQITSLNYLGYFSDALDIIKQEGRYREFVEIARIAGNFPIARDFKGKKEVVVWCSNDYLGMGQNPVVIEAMQNAITNMGAGAGGTRNISGNHHPIVELEQELASLHDKERALLFTSGYVANETTLATLPQLLPDMVYFSDAKNHSSMINGIRYSRAEKHIFRHNDLAHLRELLASVDISRPKVIAFESLYSMDGDVSPIKEICQLAEEFDAITYLDEVHAVGLYGEKGAGIAESLGLQNEVTIIQGTLGKAYGVIGGYIASSDIIIDAIRSYGSGFIFTTSLPPAIAAAATASVRYLKSHDAERKALHANANKLKIMLKKAGINVIDNGTHLLPIMIGDAVRSRKISRILLDEYNIYVQHINYPTVPRGSERLRVVVTPLHTKQMMEEFVLAVKEAIKKV